MLKNYLTTALRNLRREKGNTFLNLFGLTLGVAGSLVLFLLIRHHTGFDTFHSKYDRIYRVGSQSKGNNGQDYTPGVPSTLPDAFRLDFPEAEEVTFTSYRNGGMVTIPKGSGEPVRFSEERGIVYAEPSLFRVFDIPVVMGDAQKGIDEPLEAMVCRSWAVKYFGREDAIGEVLMFENKSYKVTGILEEPSLQTDLPFSLILSYVTIEKETEEHGWNSTWSDEHCYISLRDGEDVSKIESRMPAFVEKHLGKDNNDKRTFILQPLHEIHFDERFGNYNYSTVSRATLLSLGIVAVFLILTACINFINLSTAEAVKRSKEVGIRKSLGSTRKQLVIQFLGEGALITTASVVLAAAAAGVAVGWLNGFLNLKLAIQWSDPLTWAILVTLILVVSTLSGLYPSLVISGFNPVTALKNKMGNRQTSGYGLRRLLVVTQFFISQFLLIGTIVLITQMNFFQAKDLGFRKDAIVNIPIPVRETPASDNDGQPSKMRTLRDIVANIPGVESASLSNTAPASGSVSGTGFTIEGNPEFFETQVKTIDSSYVGLFGLELLRGQNIEDADTARGFLVNEKLASIAGYKDPSEILGKRIKMWGKNLPVVGVLKNFHTVSLHDPIEPTILLNRIRNYRNLSVRLSPGDMQSTIEQVKQQWEAAYPEYIFSYEFLDESIRNFYETEQKTSVLLGLFTTLAIIIGCMGLFGLASFMANQRVKEIGVRKVLGASVESILMMFSREFGLLVIVGFLIAAPAAWYVMNQWLNEFAYKISIGPAIFAEGFVISMLIAILTVGYRSMKAATVNPVESLRSE